MINWIANKNVSFENISSYLDICKSKNHYTNDGPLQFVLENKLKNTLDIEKSIVLTSNGTSALHAVTSMFSMVYGRDLRWITQDFTFPSSVQGTLKDTQIFDIDNEYGLDLDKLQPIDNYDGIIVTNVFGFNVDIDKYVNFCRVNNKLLIFDNAASPFTKYKGKNISDYGDASIISLHHTKPIGFGEGGAIVINEGYKPTLKQIINFGYTKERKDWNNFSSNYRMSDISASFIIEYLNNFNQICDKHIQLTKYFIKNSGFELIKEYNESLLSCLPIKLDGFDYEENMKEIEYKKYYTPLTFKPNSLKLFNNILCLPLHVDINTEEFKRLYNKDFYKK